MVIVYKKFKDWLEESEWRKDKAEKDISYLVRVIETMGTKAKIEYGITSLNLNIILLQQVIVNAYDDLSRIRNYHPIDYPNYVKEAAYIAYWFSQKKPVSICDDELIKVINNYNFSDYQKLKLININELIALQLVFGIVFKKRKARFDKGEDLYKDGEKQINILQKYLFYYFIYRLDSPKELEAIIYSLIHEPFWEYDKRIWDISNIIDEF